MQAPLTSSPLPPSARGTARMWGAAAVLAVIAFITLPLAAAATFVIPVTAPVRGFEGLQSAAQLCWLWAFLGCPVAALLVVIMLLVRSRWLLPGLVVLIGFAAGFLVSPLVTQRAYRVRVRYLMQVPKHAAPVISALHAYQQTHGMYPRALGALVPEYLPEIPHTGLAAYPEFDYALDDENNFTLRVRVCVPAKFDYLEYNSAQDYSAYGTPGRIEEVLAGRHRSDRFYLMRGGWAFYAE